MIAQVVSVHVDTAAEWAKGFSESPEDGLSEFPSGFTPPIYNVWKKQTKTNAERFSNHNSSYDLPSSAKVLALLEHSLMLTA